MYAKKFRLPIANKKIIAQQTVSSPYFLVKLKRNNEGENRFGIIISNHSVKKSVKRHFWKRIIADTLQAWPNLQKDVLIVVSPKIETANKKVINEELYKTLKQLQAKELKS